MVRILLISLLFWCALTGFQGNGLGNKYIFPELTYFPTMPDSKSNPVTKAGVDLGRHLFYDPILSLDSTLSCAGCHRQESAFSDSPHKFSKGFNGEFQFRNTPPLFNLAWHPLLFWDGRAESIETQVFHPVATHSEMNLGWKVAVNRIENSRFYREKFVNAFGPVKIDSVLISRAIAQFERTLLSFNSKYDSVIRGEAYFTNEEYEGFILINDQTKGDCLHCHTTDANVLGSTFAFSNNGLDNISDSNALVDKGLGGVTGNLMDIGKFKIPSLRNVAITAPYMHDGRFSTLREVLDFYSHGIKYSLNIDSKMQFVHQKGAILSNDEKDKIIVFLKTLTDSAFITNPSYSSPFLE